MFSSSAAGRHVFSAATFGKRGLSPSLRGATRTAAWFCRGGAPVGNGLPTSRIRFLVSRDEQCQFMDPRSFQARMAVMSKDARRSIPQDARDISRQLYLNWDHASSRQLERILVDPDGANKLLLDVAGDVVGQCEVCQAFDKSPRLPVAKMSSVSRMMSLPCMPWMRTRSTRAQFNEGGPVDLLFVADVAALHAMDAFSKYPPLGAQFGQPLRGVRFR